MSLMDLLVEGVGWGKNLWDWWYNNINFEKWKAKRTKIEKKKWMEFPRTETTIEGVTYV